MTRISTLFQTALLKVHRFDHPQNEIHVDGQFEVLPAYGITFLNAGKFRIVRSSGAWDFAPGDVLFSYPGISQRIFHPAEGAKDECIGIRFEQELIEDALGTLPDVRPVPLARASARTAFQMNMITEALRAEDPMMLEGIAMAAAEVFLTGDNNLSLWASVERSYAWYRLRIQRVCDLLTQDYASSHSLSHLGKIAQMSPFHLNRVFHYLVGVPLHHYVLRLRIAIAARAIRAGQSVTDAAYSSGFNSLSYFSRAFHKHFGVAPKCYRQLKLRRRAESGVPGPNLG